MKFTVDQSVYWQVTWIFVTKGVDYSGEMYEIYDGRSIFFPNSYDANLLINELRQKPCNTQIKLAHWTDIT